MALRHFRAHTVVHLKFLARSRVLHGFALLIGAGSALALLPVFFFETTSNRFEMLKYVAHDLHGSAAVITAVIGLVVLWSHRRQRSVKMVATKPSSFEGWIASVFTSAAIVGLVVHALVASLTFGLSLYWEVPYQLGFLYLALDRYCESLIALGLLTGLSTICHPIIATIGLLLFNEATFRLLGTMIAGVAAAGVPVPLLPAWQALFSTLYYLAPTFGPFDAKTDALQQSLRVTSADWQYLAGGAGYALLVCAFAYVMTVAVLRRRQLT